MIIKPTRPALQSLVRTETLENVRKPMNYDTDHNCQTALLPPNYDMIFAGTYFLGPCSEIINNAQFERWFGHFFLKNYIF